jgi:nucleotide-binding universal stress UspA family protein
VKKFLVAIDLSDSSRKMLQIAIEETIQDGADMVLVHAFRPGIQIGAIYRDGTLDPIRELEAEMKYEEAVEFTTEWASVARAAGLNVEAIAREGHPAELILEVAEEVGAKRIIMGRHAQGAVANFILGSTADKVVRRSKIPVLVVPIEHA